MKAPVRAQILILAAGAIFFLVLTKSRVSLSGNEASRFGTIQALVELSTLSLDKTLYAWTPDHIDVDQEIISNKPPLLSFVGALVYFPLHHGLGLTFEKNEGAILYWLTLLLCGGSALLLYGFFFAESYRESRSLRGAVLLTIALMAGTLIPVFAVSFNNHTVAALFLFLGYRSARRQGEHAARSSFFAGLFLGLGFAVDTLSGAIFTAAFFLERGLLARNRGQMSILGMYALGALIPGLTEAVLNLIGHGHLLPAIFYCAQYKSGQNVLESGRHIFTLSFARYCFHALLGYRGLISYSPILGVGLVLGCLRIKRKPANPALSPDRTAQLASLLCIAAYLAVDPLFAYGGWSYGFRYLVPLTAVLLLPACRLFQSEARSKLKLTLVGGTIVWGSVVTALGVYQPWPCCFEGGGPIPESDHPGRNPVALNLVTAVTAANPQSDLARDLRKILSEDDILATKMLSRNLLGVDKTDQALSVLREARRNSPADPELKALIQAIRKQQDAREDTNALRQAE